MSGYTYDAGVLVAADRNERLVWALHRRLLEHGDTPSVPSTVLAQAWRSGPQAQFSRFLAGCEVRPFIEAHARSAGWLLARASTADIVDAGVVVIARERGEDVLTSDPDDLKPLSTALGPPLVVIRSINDLRY
ncbi:MAG: twitching motility protein PilT [Acidimicrobiales bacterium]